MGAIQLDASVTTRVDRAIAAIENIGIQLGRIADAIRKPLQMPGILGIRVTSERFTDMADKLKFVVAVPAAEGDVVNRRVSVTLPDGSVQAVDVPGKEAADTPEFEVDQDAVVSISCINVDDSGNESEARVQAFTIKDTIPPAAPGELGVRVTAETPE